MARVVESYDIGEIVVAEELSVVAEDFGIVAEAIVDVSHFAVVGSGDETDPFGDFFKIDLRHVDTGCLKCNHNLQR